MQCPRCGGWHYGYGTPPPVNYVVPDPVNLAEAETILEEACEMPTKLPSTYAEQDPYDKAELPKGSKLWEPRVYGTDERSQEVTVAFGRPGTTREEHFMIRDSIVPEMEFYHDKQRNKGHDHGGPEGHTDRGKYTGWENFHDSE